METTDITCHPVESLIDDHRKINNLLNVSKTMKYLEMIGHRRSY